MRFEVDERKRTTPRRFRSCCGGRSRLAGTRRRGRCHRSRRRGVFSLGNVALPDVHAVLAARLELVAPGEELPLEAAAGGVLPLRLGRQALAGPRAVRLSVVPGDVYDGMVDAAVEIRLRAFRTSPVSLLHLAPPGRAARRRAWAGSRPAGAPRRRTTSRSARPRSRGRCPRRSGRSRALETAQASIQNGSSRTRRTGPSPSSG